MSPSSTLPSSGTREPAEQGKLVILASGPSEARERCQQVFEALGQRTLWLGEAGTGTRAKVATNSWVVGVVGVLAETIALFEALDVDPECFFEALEGGPLDLALRSAQGRGNDEALIRRSSLQAGSGAQGRRADPAKPPRARDLSCRSWRRSPTACAGPRPSGHGEEDMAATYWVSAPEFVRTANG